MLREAFGATAASRWTRRATRSSSPSRPRRERSGGAEAQRARAAGADGPSHRHAAADGGGLRRRATCIGPRGSPLPATAGRCSCRRRRLRSSTRRASRSRRAPAQGLERAGADLPARRRRLPAAEDAVPDEPADPGDAVPRPRARARGRARVLARDDARLLTLTGRRRVGEDAARAPGGRRGGGSVSGRGVVGAARSARDPAESDRRARALGGGGSLPELVDGRRLLLLLDNFEHVVEAAPEVAASSRNARMPTCS